MTRKHKPARLAPYRVCHAQISPTVGLVVGCCLLLSGRGITTASAQPCEPDWDVTIGQPGMSSQVTDLVVFDDGSGNGPALYAGGAFTTAGGQPANYIAKWDGSEWWPLGSGMNNNVNALAVFDDGSGPALYAGGNFTTAGGVDANYMARWDGAEWSALGGGTSGFIDALVVFDDGDGPALYAAGRNHPDGRIVKWNGANWSPLGSGTDGSILSLAVFDDGSGNGPALFAGGLFSEAGGQPANSIARWNGSHWSPLGAGTNSGIIDLAAYDNGLGGGPALYACGWFSEAGGESANYIARWDGVEWSSFGAEPNVWPISFGVFDDGSGGGPALYVGGEFTEVGGQPASHIARWDGLEWSPLGAGTNYGVTAFAEFDDGSGNGPSLYIGGWFLEAGGLPAYNIASWSGCGEPDTDGDGLLDIWEIIGIPYTAQDGSEAYYPLDFDGDGLSDADPYRKDLFVEIDMMETLTFPQDAVDLVVDAFANAPISNPEGSPDGIRLHILVDENTIQFEEVTETPGNSWPIGAAGIKALYYGTVNEQLDPDSEALLEARAKAVRYCIVYNDASGGMGGIGELGGDDFLIFVGGYGAEDKAAVFMHELGHNLGLRHGGDDDLNMKPNYPSIMNYVHSYRRTWNSALWRLDFSRERLATINEADLDEHVGLGLGGSGYYDDFVVPFYGVVPDGADCYPEGQWGQPKVSYGALDATWTNDYNLDCDEDDSGVAADLNYIQSSGLPGSGDPSPGETLRGFDDWANIVLPVSDGGGAFAGEAPTDELTRDQLAWMEANFPRICTADWNVDGTVNTQDFLAYLNDWSARDPSADLNADGAVNTQDFLAFLNAWTAGC